MVDSVERRPPSAAFGGWRVPRARVPERRLAQPRYEGQIAVLAVEL